MPETPDVHEAAERTEEAAIDAAEALRALTAVSKVHRAEVSAAETMRKSHEATGWVSVPLVPTALGKALIATDLVTVRRSSWRRRVQCMGLQPEVFPLPDDLPDVDSEALKRMSKDERRRLDKLTATVLQLRGSVLRVDSGSPELRCRVDLPLPIASGAKLYQSPPFRVTLVNLLRLLVNSRSEHTWLEPSAEEWLRYNPARHTLELHLCYRGGSGKFPLTTQPLAQDLDPSDFDAPAETTVALDAALLQRALDTVSVSLPDRTAHAKYFTQPTNVEQSRGGPRAFAVRERLGSVDIRNGRALCTRAGVSYTIFRNPGLAGLDLHLEAEDVASLAKALGRLDSQSATLRTSATRYVFSDGVLAISVRRCQRSRNSDPDQDVEAVLSAPSARCTVDGGQMLSALRWSLWGLTRDDHRTHVRFGPLYRSKRTIASGDVVAQSLIDAGLGAVGMGPEPGPVAPCEVKVSGSREEDMSDHEVGSHTHGPIDATAAAPPDRSTEASVFERVPMSEWQPMTGWDTTPNGRHEVRDCLIFLTPGSQPSMGWNPAIVDLVGPSRGELSAEWLRTGQIFDIRQTYRALLWGKQTDVEIRLAKYRMVIEETDGRDHVFTVLYARDPDGFWSRKLLPCWGTPADARG